MKDAIHSLCIQTCYRLTFTTSPRSFSLFFSCFLITNPLAVGGCAWVNRAVGACHVCSSGERSWRRSGMRWFVLIGSYLETGLMELSKLYANRLFPYHCRCTRLRCTAHTHAHTFAALSSIRYIMGTQIFGRRMVFKCNTRRGSQISNHVFLLAVFQYKHAATSSASQDLFFLKKPRQKLCLRVTPGVWTQRQPYIWELSGKTIPFLTLRRSKRVFIFTSRIVLLPNEVVQNSLWKSGYERQRRFWLVLFITRARWESAESRLFMVGPNPCPPSANVRGDEENCQWRELKYKKHSTFLLFVETFHIFLLLFCFGFFFQIFPFKLKRLDRKALSSKIFRSFMDLQKQETS